MADVVEEQDDFAKVVGWRLHQLIEVGYELPYAERLAPRTDVDLHDAVELVAEKHCPPHLAVRILL